MTQKPLLIFDFDGVIINGMNEYWNSSRQAAINLLQVQEKTNLNLPQKPPEAFKYLRPWVKQGWEMVLITAELTRPNSYLITKGFKKFSDYYQEKCKEALDIWELKPNQFQEALDNVRKENINNDLQTWLNSHQCFSGIAKRINQLKKEGHQIIILTTKGAAFTNQLLNSFNINFDLLYGHESGGKIDILTKLCKEHPIHGFIEDRRATLETVINNSNLVSIPCFLASWGYLKPDDLKDLPTRIHILEPNTFATPLANWN